MRRIVLLALGVVLAAALAAPTAAAPPVKSKSKTASANAFWYSTQTLSRSSYRSTVWYVGVFSSTEGTWSDLYQEVATCRVTRRGDVCDYEFRIGFSDLAGQTFTLDSRGLTTAHIDATYDLYESFDEEGNPIGTATPTHIVADWTGIGDTSQERFSSTVRTECATFRWTFNGLFRSAEATGSVNGVDLGETYDAWLSSGTSSSFERTTC